MSTRATMDLSGLLLPGVLIPAVKPKDACRRCTGRFPGIPNRATRLVRCWLGCEHIQCEPCAALTAKEAKEDWSGGD